MNFIQKHLFRNVDSFSLGLFRCLFGAFMLVEMMQFSYTNTYVGMVIAPQFFFSYEYLGFIKPAGEGVMNAIHFLMGLAALGMMLGYRSRICSAVFFVLFTYFMLCCKGLWNNHFYLFSLISFLLIFTDSGRSFSIEKREKVKEKIVPIWQLNMLKIQVFIVYFYGGISKLNPDWLYRQEPMRATLEALGSGSFMTNEVVVSFFTYGGLCFDLFIGFLLMFKKTRLFAVAGVVFFNFTNAYIYDDIGIFPFVMLAATILFFEPDGKLVNQIKDIFVNVKTRKVQVTSGAFSPVKKSVLAGLGVYFVFQFLFPLRHHFITDNVIWTGIGKKFAWHMKVEARGGEDIAFRLVEKGNGTEAIYRRDNVTITEKGKRPKSYPGNGIQLLLNVLQTRYLAESPVMAWQFANFLESTAQKNQAANNNKDYEVYCEIKTSFNGREPQYIIDPSVDLTTVEYDPLGENTWMLPLKED